MKSIVMYVSGFYSGGVEAFVTSIASNIDTSRFCVLILSRYVDLQGKSYNKAHNFGIKFENLNIQHLHLSNYAEFKKKLEAFFDNNPVDVLHVNGTCEPILLKVAKERKAKIILHAHEPYREGGSQIKNCLKSLIERKNISLADEYLACSKSTAEAVFGKYGISSTRVLYNGINIDTYRFDMRKRNAVRNKLDLKGTVIGHVGRMTDVKNQIYILKIAEKLVRSDGFSFVFVGNGEEEANLKQFAIDHQLQNNVFFLGERDDVYDIMSAFDILLMPSKFEGLSIVLLEAQASGLKCFISNKMPQEAVCTDLVSVLPIEEKYINGWVKEIQNTNFEYDRKKYADDVLKSKFNINNTCMVLEEMYE